MQLLPGADNSAIVAKVSSNFSKRVGLFTIGTMLSRVLGLIREQVFAYLFGASMATDAFNMAFRIPNFLRDLVAENAVSAAFVPEMVDGLAAAQKEEVWRFASNIFNALFLFVGMLVVLMMIFSHQITGVVAHGFTHSYSGGLSGEALNLTANLTRIMMPLLLFVALGAWAMGVLNSMGCFFVPAAASGVFERLRDRWCRLRPTAGSSPGASNRSPAWPTGFQSERCSSSWSSCRRHSNAGSATASA